MMLNNGEQERDVARDNQQPSGCFGDTKWEKHQRVFLSKAIDYIIFLTVQTCNFHLLADFYESSCVLSHWISKTEKSQVRVTFYYFVSSIFNSEKSFLSFCIRITTNSTDTLFI